MLIDLREGRREGERQKEIERERNLDVREACGSGASSMRPDWGSN